MPLSKENDNGYKGQGNWLGKQRLNFSVSGRFYEMLHRIALEYGVNHSVALELCVREKFTKEFGPVPEIKYPGGSKAR